MVDVNTNKLLGSLDKARITELRFSPKGTLLAAWEPYIGTLITMLYHVLMHFYGVFLALWDINLCALLWDNSNNNFLNDF